MKAVIVTGGAGYIGSAVCKRLADADYLPVVIDNLSTGHEEFVKWGPLFKGNVSDETLISHVAAKYRPIAAIHFAASAYVGESVLNPSKYYRNNISESIGLITNLFANGISKVVFSSSCATYGEASEGLISEGREQKPVSPYGFSKFVIERMLQDMSYSGELNYVILRYFNAAGAVLNSGTGEMHANETHLIPRALRSALDQTQFEIFGDDYETPDGTAVRDYVHVSDLADAHVRSLKHLESGLKSIELNLGTGTGQSVREVIDAIERLGFHVPVKVGPRRDGDPSSLVASAELARAVLGWTPISSNIDNIVGTAAVWEQSRRIKA